MKNIQAEQITLGKNVYISETAIIRGISGKAQNIIIGDSYEF